MAIIKSFSPKQNLSNFQVFINDDKPNSEYFKITEFNDTFTGGKNGFLIDGSECLKETSEVKIEILDVEGNPIYFEPGKGIPDYYEGTSKLVGVYVYEDTPIGTAKITILGELKSYFDDNGNKVDIPNEWKDVYNVKWERTIQVNKNLANENIVRFVKRPKVTITEIVKTIFNKSIPQVTQSGSLEGISLTPTAGTDLSIFSTPTNYKLKITDSGSWTSSIDENNITVRVPTETNLAAGSSNTGSLNWYLHEADGAGWVGVNLYVDGVQTGVVRGSGSLEWYDSPQTYNFGLHLSNNPSGAHYRMEIYDMSSNVMVYETSTSPGSPSGFMSASSTGIIDSYEFTGELGKVYGLMIQGIPDANPSSAHNFQADYESETFVLGLSQKFRSTSYPLFEGNVVTIDGDSSDVHTIKQAFPLTITDGVISNAFPSLKDYNNFFNPDVSTTEYVPKIIEVLNDKEVLVDIPFTGSNNLVSDFNSTSYTASFAHTEAQVITESALTGSFAKIDINNLKTFVGDVARVKVFRKSKNAIGDFQFVQESKLESIELLRDIATAADTELSYGEFDSYNLINYWTTGSNSPITLDNSVLKNSLHIDYTGSGVDTISTEQTLSITEGVEYAINFKTLLSGSFVTSFEDSYIRAYLSGSDYEQELLTTSGSAIYKTRQKVSQNILASQTVSDTHLKFDVKGDDWFISNVSLRNAQETSFSPDEFTLIQDIPRKTASETFDFRFEFYDVNNNFIPVNVVGTKEFDGGNDFPSSDKLLTFEADRNAFRFSSGSIGNPPFQQIQLKTSTSNLVGSLTFASSAFDASGVYIDPSSYTGEYPGKLTNPSNAGALIEIKNFSGSDDTITVGSIVYTASLDGVEEFETVFRLEDGDNAPQLIVTSNANQFIYEPTTLSPKPSGQSLTVKAQRKNLASLITPITVNSGSNKPALTFVDTVNGIDTYTISATEFSSSFASSDFDSVTYEFTGSDVFGNEQSDEITLSKVINFDAVSLVLSNESTSFPAKSTGEILGNLVPSSGSVQMFIGGTEIQPNTQTPQDKNTFDITAIASSNVTASVNPPTDEFYSINGFDSNKDSGSLTLNIEYLAGDNITSQSFQKVVSYTKAKKAVPTVLTKISPSTQTINSSSLGYDSPQTMEVIVQEGGDEYTFDSSNLSGGGDALAQKFNINSLFVDSGSISNSDNILTFGSLTSSFNSIIGSASLDYVDSEGTYVTGKKVRFDLAVSKIGVDGINGASGSNARAVSLSSTKYAIVYDGDGVLFPSNQDFTLSGSAQNFNTPEFQFLSGGAEIHPFATTSEVIISSSGYPQRGDTSLFEVRVREQGGSDIGVFDNIDVFAVQSGSDAFTVFLTNEAHVFSATSQSVVTSDLEDGAFETRFFRGADQYDLGTTGKTYSISATSSSIELTQSTNSNQKLFTPTSITADSGSATIVVTDNNTGQTFDKKYSFTLSKEGLVGERGADGANGASGSNAKIVSLSSTKYAVVYDGDGVLFPTDQNFNLSGSAQNFTNAEFQFLSASAVLHDFSSTSEVTISSSGYPEAGNATLYEVRVRENGGSYEGVFDNIDVFGVQSGSDSFTTFLTNEAHVFSANSDGVVTSTLSDGSFETRFFRGAEQYNFGTSGKSYSVSATSSSIELTQSTNSNQRKFTPSSVSADSGTASIILTDNNTGQTFPKTYTFSKSKKGAPVTTIAASPQSQTITSGSGGIGTPTDITITVNEGGSDYGYDTAGAIPANNFRITGVTNATNNNDGTISPDDPTSSTPVTGVATISYTNSEGTAFTSKTIPFDVGVAGLGDTGPKGDNGDPGGQGDAGLRTAQGMVHYNVTSSNAPTGPDTSTDSFNFSTGVMSNMTNGWQMGTPTYESGNSNKYWYATFSSVENSSGAGIATGTNNSFGSVTQAIGFSGLVSFTATDTIGDGSSNLSFGVAGSTLINGDNISTGRIISTNYVTGSGDGFTDTGIEFNLDSSSLSGEKFTINPSGDAKFKGDITGASGTFSGTVQIGGTSLNANNTLNENTTAADVDLGNVLDQAQTTTFRQNGIPTATAAGDIWIDTNDGNKMYVATNAGDNQVTSGEWVLSNVSATGIGLGNVDNQSASTIQAGTTAANVGLPNLDNSNFDSSGNVIGGTIGGITIAATKLYQGTGTFANSNTGFYLDNGANFSLQDKLAFNGSTGDLAISGSIFAESGTFAGDVAGATISVPVTSPKFTVTSDGILSAQTASIEGTITATGGRIGEFDIAGSKLSGKGEYMVLDASETPNIYFYSGSGAGYTTIVKLSSADSLTPIELSTAPAMGGTFPYTAASDVDTETATGTSFATTTQNPTHLYEAVTPTSTYRFPASGNLTSDHVGLVMNVTALLNRKDPGTNTFIYSVGESLSGNVAFMSNSATVGLRMKRSSTSTQVAFGQGAFTDFALLGSGQIGKLGTTSQGGTNHNSGTTTKTINYTYTIDVADVGTFFLFDTYIKSGVSQLSVSGGTSGTLTATYRTPDISTMTVTVPTGTDIQPFTEMSKGGFQVVSDADPTNLKSVKIPADKEAGNTLIVSGSIEASGNITAFASSDERLKENIITIPNSLDKVKSLNGVLFNWKEGYEKVHAYGTLRDVGVIAQDVQKILPEIVKENVHNRFLGVRYEKLTPLLLEAVKELSKKVEDLENKLKDKE